MKIKRIPEDFLVEELLSTELGRAAAPSGGRHALYRLVKRGLDTDEAIALVASALAVPRRTIGFGGLKDRHAITTQYLTIGASGVKGAALPERWESRGIALERIGTLPEPLTAAGTAGNLFRITVRGLTRGGCAAIDEGRRFLSLPSGRGRALGFVNYFGAQRFGSARHGRGFAARRLVEGDFEGALRLLLAVSDRKETALRKSAARAIARRWGDWRALRRELPPCPERRVVETLERTRGDYRAGFLALPPLIRQIVVEAYQSFLWNEVARRFVRERCPRPFVESRSASGVLVFPRTESIPEDIRALVIPLFSPSTRLADSWGGAADAVLAGEGISLARLRIPGLRTPYFGGIPRTLFAIASSFSAGPPERDEYGSAGARFKRRLRFALPRGAYATVLLDALGSAPQNTL